MALLAISCCWTLESLPRMQRQQMGHAICGSWMENEIVVTMFNGIAFDAVMVLFLFVVMMLDINLNRMREGYWNYLLPALVVAGIFLTELIILIGGRVVFSKPTEVPDITPETDVEIRRYKEGKARTMKRKKELRSK